MSVERNTMQRQLVLDAVQSLHTHPTADEVYGYIAARHPSISRATVYRNLALLGQKGAVLRVSHLNAADRFDFNTEPHHHFYCTGCGRVFDVDMPHQHDLMERVEDTHGFEFHTAELCFTGRCPSCKKGN